MMYYNNKKLALSVFWVVLGAALVALTVYGTLDSSLYSGMGGAIMTVGALQVARNLKYRKDADYRNRVDTELQDERNRFLRMKSWSWAGYVAVLTEAAGSVAAMVLGQHTVQMVLSYSVCLILTAYWVCYLILSKKY